MNKEENVILGLDEVFADGIFVGSRMEDASAEAEADILMQDYFRKKR